MKRNEEIPRVKAFRKTKRSDQNDSVLQVL